MVGPAEALQEVDLELSQTAGSRTPTAWALW